MTRTGPRTARGKATSRRNAWKHGILSIAVVLDEAEDAREWQAHVDGIFESLRPEGHLEHMLAERVAIALWKMRRVDFFQAVATDRYMKQARADLQIAKAFSQGTIASGVFPDISDNEIGRGKAARILPPQDDLDKIMRYESHLHRQYIQTLHELEAMQARRRGESTPLARLDITGAPGG